MRIWRRGSRTRLFLEFPYDPPVWSLDQRDFMLARPLKIDSSGTIVLSERPGMGYEFSYDALARTCIR